MIPGAAFTPAAERRDILAAVHPAVRLGGAVLAIVTAFVVPAWAAAGWLALGSALLAAAGWGPTRQLAALRRWWPVVALVMLVHTFTTLSAAPLGHPSRIGLLAGVTALVRVGASATWLALLARTTGLDALAAGLGWWLTPLRRVGVGGDDLGLVLAVAMGTAPALLGEARRVEAVTMLRRNGPGGRGRPDRLGRLKDRASVVLPLIETVGRRADALALSLRHRRPQTVAPGRPAVGSLLVLAAWTVALVLLAGRPAAQGG
ncbi:MAG TPA: energy-coupling factor transporter transmembrane component T [Candidatus Krumholzibacteria bacterium]|nr:energy-coupling factor transporter transmembrane component T [Candidatus Krumholzibacteria bacterium]